MFSTIIVLILVNYIDVRAKTLLIWLPVWDISLLGFPEWKTPICLPLIILVSHLYLINMAMCWPGSLEGSFNTLSFIPYIFFFTF